MKNHKIITITLFSLTILLLLNSCPDLFKDVETIYIDNKSDYTINYFINNDYENTIAPGAKYKTANYTNVKHTLLCTSGSNQWGPESITLTKGKPYTWTIDNPSEPIPVPTLEPAETPLPTSEPTPIPQGDIRVNNISSWNVNVYTSGILAGTIDAGISDVYTKDIGNYNLLAQPQGTTGSWEEIIELTVDGYTWNIQDFPTAEPTPTLTPESTQTPTPTPTPTSTPVPTIEPGTFVATSPTHDEMFDALNPYLLTVSSRSVVGTLSSRNLHTNGISYYTINISIIRMEKRDANTIIVVNSNNVDLEIHNNSYYPAPRDSFLKTGEWIKWDLSF